MSTRADRRAGRAAKRYVPKPVHVNAVERAITGAAKINPAQVAQTRAALTQTFTAFGQGFDCAAHWRSMADAMNVAEQLARLGICCDASSVDRITEAQSVLTAVADRHAATGSWTLRSAERAALDDGLWMHGVQLEHCCYREYEHAVARSLRIITQALAGNVAPGVRVVVPAAGVQQTAKESP